MSKSCHKLMKKFVWWQGYSKQHCNKTTHFLGKFRVIHSISTNGTLTCACAIVLYKVKHNTRYSLRSSEGVCLMHPKGRMKKSFGDRSFSVAAPTLWNNLPASLCSMSSISSFKSQLKTHLFRLAFNSF